jgi:hypothetical protein
MANHGSDRERRDMVGGCLQPGPQARVTAVRASMPPGFVGGAGRDGSASDPPSESGARFAFGLIAIG